MQDSIAIIPAESAKKDSAFSIQDFNALRTNDSVILTRDSVISVTPQKQMPTVTVDTLFKNHSLEFNRFYPQTLDKFTPDWFTVILILVIIAVTSLKVFYSKILFQILNAFVNNNTTNQIIRDENILVQRASILLSVICYGVLALFAYKVSEYYHYRNDLIGRGFARFLFIAFFIALAYSVKMIALKIFGFIFNYDKPVASYIFNLFLINNVLGIVLLPVLIILTYLNFEYISYVFYAAIAIVILFFLYRLLRGIMIWTSVPRYNLFYLFLYICALEIAPMLIIIKIITL